VARPQPAPDDPRCIRVGAVDLAEFEVIDAHVHRFDRARFSELNDKWNRTFVDALPPFGDFEGRHQMESSTLRAVEQHVLSLPRMTGLLNYIAAVHGRPADVETLERLAAEHIRGDFTAYPRSILDRERIAAVVMDQTGLPDLCAWRLAALRSIKRLSISAARCRWISGQRATRLRRLPGAGPSY
jgi:hypothetical protein